MSCPVCFSKDTSYFASKNNYIFNRCRNCKTIFLLNLPTQNNLSKLYIQEFSYEDGLRNEVIIRKRSHEILNKLVSLAPQAKTLCDVGSGYGFFLDVANKKGYSTLGIEPSTRLARYSQIKFNQTIFIGGIEDYIKPSQDKFDIVTCIHVVEHIVRPRIFINHILQLLKPGGLLYIETPNSDSHLLYAEKEEYTFLIPPYHIWLFSKESIRLLLPKQAYFIYVNTYSYSEHVMGIIKQFIKKQKVANDNSTYSKKHTNIQSSIIRKRLSFLLFDRFLAPLFIGLFNLYHNGSILELYIRKKSTKCGL